MSNIDVNPTPPSGVQKYFNDLARLVPVEAVTLYTAATTFIWQNQYDLDRNEKLMYLGSVVLVCLVLVFLVLRLVRKERRVLLYILTILAFLLWMLNVNQVEIFQLVRVESRLWSGLAAFGLMAFSAFAPFAYGSMTELETPP